MGKGPEDDLPVIHVKSKAEWEKFRFESGSELVSLSLSGHFFSAGICSAWRSDLDNAQHLNNSSPLQCACLFVTLDQFALAHQKNVSSWGHS
jgi:hypothetical protein